MLAGVIALGLSAFAPVNAQAQGAAHSTAPAKAPAKAAQAPAQAAPGVPDVEGQVADLRKRLNVTPAQQTQFDALAAAIRQNAQDMTAGAPPASQNATTSAVDSMRAAQKAAQSEADGLNKMIPPLQALYETLSPEQKKVADQYFGDSDAPPPPPQQQPAPKRR
jgi:hypothetical protein